MPGPGTSTKSFKQAFLKNLFLGLQARTSTSAMSPYERKVTIKSSADVAMATARGPGAKWSKAILAQASSACKMQRCRRIVIRCRGRKRSLARGPAVPASRGSRKRSLGSGGGGDVVRRRTMALREVIPGGRDATVDEATLLREAMDYVVHLRAQVDVLRQVSEAVQRSTSRLSCCSGSSSPAVEASLPLCVPMQPGPILGPGLAADFCLDLFHRILARRLAVQFPEFPSRSPVLQWHDALIPGVTPLIMEYAADAVVPDFDASYLREELSPASIDLTESKVVLDLTNSPLLLFNAVAEEQEATVGHRWAHDKRDLDSAFKTRRSSRQLAVKEPVGFNNMVSRAKVVKASRMIYGKGSARLRKAVANVGLDDAFPDFIPLSRLHDLGKVCSVDSVALVPFDST